MKISLIMLAALAAFTVAGQAADKEVVKAHHVHAYAYRQQPRGQVALFVSGRGLGEQHPASTTQSVSHAQVGQGVGITFYTGAR